MEPTQHINIFYDTIQQNYSIKAKEINANIKTISENLYLEKNSLCGSIVLWADRWDKQNAIAQTVREWLYQLPCIESTSQNIRNLEAGLNTLQSKRFLQKKFWKLSSLPQDPQQTDSTQSLNLDKFLRPDISIYPLTRNCLLQLTFNDPNKQIEILEKHPLDAHSVYYDHKKGNVHYPLLAEETIDFLLQDDTPSIWNLAICSQQRSGLLEKFKAYPINELVALGEVATQDSRQNFDAYWDKSLVKIVFDACEDHSVTQFLSTLQEKKSPWFTPCLRHALEQKREFDERKLFQCPDNLADDVPVIDGSNQLYGNKPQSHQKLHWKVINWTCQGNSELLIENFLCQLKSDSFISFDEFDINNPALIESNQKEKCLWWLAYAVNLKVPVIGEDSDSDLMVLEFPQAPDLVRNEVANNPKFYAEFLFGLNCPATNIEKRLAPICKGIGLTGGYLKDFGSYLSSQFNPRLKELLKRPFDQKFLDDLIDAELDRQKNNSKELELKYSSQIKEEPGFIANKFGIYRDFEDPLEKLRKSVSETTINKKNSMSIRGNAMVQILKQALIYKKAPYNVTEQWKNGKFLENHPISIIPNDLLAYLFQRSTPYQILNVAITCQQLYHKICSSEGDSFWESLGFGSIGAVRHMTNIFNRVMFIQNPGLVIKDLQQVLHRTWPASHFNLFNSDKLFSSVDSLSFDVRERFLNLNFESLAKFPDPLEYYYNWLTSADIQENLKYGIPFEALETVCEGLMTINDLTPPDELETPLKILSVISRDHPYFDFTDKVPTHLIGKFVELK